MLRFGAKSKKIRFITGRNEKDRWREREEATIKTTLFVKTLEWFFLQLLLVVFQPGATQKSFTFRNIKKLLSKYNFLLTKRNTKIDF